jgi:succinate dehydrogenase / fumarate reductase cytochrome b subunit
MANTLQLAARKYRWKYAGMLGFWIQRVTGIGLLVYLGLHVHTIHQLNDPQSFQAALDEFGQPIFKLGEIGLLDHRLQRPVPRPSGDQQGAAALARPARRGRAGPRRRPRRRARRLALPHAVQLRRRLPQGHQPDRLDHEDETLALVSQKVSRQADGEMSSAIQPEANPLKLALWKYAWRYVGNVAFWIQRVTGVALVAYLILHVHTIHDLRDPEKFDAALAMFGKPLFKLAEIGLLATVILHALNGIRLTMIDLGLGLTRQRQAFWYFAIGLGAILFLAGAVLFLSGAIPMFIYGILRHS